MNVCVVTTFECTFDEFKAMFEKSMTEGGSEFLTEYELVKVNEHKSIFMGNVTDFEAMGTMMASPEAKKWDEENGCVDTVYMMQKME